MALLEWDQLADRQYQLGIDRGVLYPADGDTAVVWNGLVSVSEDATRDVKSYFQDGIKFFEYSVPKPYAAKIEAFTYPDVLDELMGVASMAPGFDIYDQPAQRFHLAYRTKVGSELEEDLAYKIHLVYNLLAAPDGVTRATVSDKAAPSTFSFGVTAIPVAVPGALPSTHISIDSREVSAETLQGIEDDLYGASGAAHILLPDDLI